ncbi:NAD-binding protein [Mycobacterium paraterrae]|uniref:NAD-binding protein n=1 Tax=Mycobacterium paraterrae TaxID=577492 RepID=A0ABY3VU07_9MYCO|nr:NAD-binding protein [Mycobacterium paraterrae]UMB70989.1 NAD-binding protein [Mycobacterium paraterrae]
MNEIIVVGSDALATTIIAELKGAGAPVIEFDDGRHGGQIEVRLEEAGIAHALAVVCAGDNDAVNLEIALLARKANPNVRVVARLSNDVLSEAIAGDNGPGAILNVAELAAPSIVKACLAEATYPIVTGGMQFVVTSSEATRNSTLRELCGDLAPVALIHGEKSPTPGVLETCPRRDRQLRAGDWMTVIGTADQVAARGIKISPATPTRVGRRPLRRIADAGRAVLDEFNPAFYPVLAAVLVLMIGSTVVLRFGHTDPPMGWIDALYFTVETITTTGYGDFAFINQPTWLRIFAIMLMFGGATTVALLVAFIADVLLSRRFSFATARTSAGHLRRHIVVIGLSALGIRVVSDLTAAGYEVAVIERDGENRFLPIVRALDVPVIIGDGTEAHTLKAARVNTARAVAVLTRDDMINIETGIVLAQMLGRKLGPTHRKPGVPLVLRVFDRSLGFALAQRFGFVNTRSTVELAAPWFIGAAIGLQVAGTFSVGQRSFVVGGISVSPNSELAGAHLSALSSQTRILAISRPDQPAVMHPRRHTRLRPGDTVHVVGPYRELLNTIRRANSPSRLDRGDPLGRVEQQSIGEAAG